ncbi:MAG: efflux RND transporter permease subunit, partial [Deltaproteobacteria bacterium]
MSLPRFSVRQSVLVNVLFFVCLLGGWVALQRTPVEYFPEVTLNTAYVSTVWSGASAEEVERLVTQKLEEEIASISDIQEMRSTSLANLSEIIVDFDENLGALAYEAALNDLRTALDRVDDLPADAEQPVLRDVTLAEVQPVVFVAVADVGGVGEIPLREVARDVRARLEDIPGTNRAQIRGEREREIRVLVDRDVAARFGLTVTDVVERIRRQNLNLPAGTFETDAGESTLRARGDYQSLKELLATVVRENPNGTYVRLAEIARVEDGLEKRRYATRYNGRPALLLSVTKRVGYDVIDLVERIERALDAYRPLLPVGVELHTTLDTSAFVAPRMQALAENLSTGVVFVVAILWFTIGFRNAILTSIAIPFSFLTAMIFFPILGITINSTTLVAMLLVSGMLVDDAIIVLENVYRLVEEGEPLRRAVVRGAEEVLWPVICAVSTTCAAFLPLLLIDGTAGKFVSILPKAVVVCLLASLFECLLILPAHYVDFGSRRSGRAAGAHAPRGTGAWGRLLALGGAIAGLRRSVESGLFRARDAYGRALDVVLAHRLSFGALLLATLVAAAGAWTHLPVDLFPGEFDNFNVLLETPSDFGLEQTDAVAQELERELAPFVGTEIVDYSTLVGQSVDSNYDELTGPNLTRILLVMTPSDENRFAPQHVLRAVREPMLRYGESQRDRIQELSVVAEQDGPPIGPPVEVRIQSDDYGLAKA